MQKQRGKDAIRLTNRTAIALRKSARRIQKLYVVLAAVLTVLLMAFAVFLGLKWLLAVPLIVVCIVLLDAAILSLARARYLTMTAQAICAEAAARQMREEKNEKSRRMQALRDLHAMKEDAAQIGEAGIHALVGQEKTAQAEEEKRTDTQTEEPEDGQHRRRRRKPAFEVLRGEQAT